MRGFRCAAVVMGLGLMAAGCASHQSMGMKVLPAPQQPLAAPPARAVALDPNLRDAAKREILAAFDTSDPRLRANAIEAAQDGLGAEARSMIVSGLSDKQPVVRFAALMAAGTLKLSDLHDQIEAMANDPSRQVQVADRYALHMLGDHSLSQDLVKFAADPDPLVRSNVAMVLGLLGEKSAVPNILRYMANDSDADVRIQVAEARWRLGDDGGLETLVSGLVSQAPDDVMLCLQGLTAPKNRVVDDYVRGKLTDPYVRIDLVAARCMGELGYDTGYSIAMRSIRSPDPSERYLAATALGYIGRSDAQSTLSGLLKDSDPSVRLAAALAILQLKAQG